MTDSILLEVLTPERQIFSAEVADLQFPTADNGYYGILPGHTPLITPVGDGLVSFTQGDHKHWLTVFGGFAEVGPDHVTILARVSETVDMIDVERAEAARLRALQILKEATRPNPTWTTPRPGCAPASSASPQPDAPGVMGSDRAPAKRPLSRPSCLPVGFGFRFPAPTHCCVVRLHRPSLRCGRCKRPRWSFPQGRVDSSSLR